MRDTIGQIFDTHLDKKEDLTKFFAKMDEKGRLDSKKMIAIMVALIEYIEANTD